MQSKVFSPDQRNIGGRRLILQQMLQHLHHVESAKSTIGKVQHIQQSNYHYQNTKLVKRTPSPMYRFLDQYKEVLNTFEKVQKIKEKRPSMEKFKNNYFMKKVNIVNQEHQKNLEKCKKRIQEMNEKSDKKNKFNYTVYPSLFFRRVDKSIVNKTCPQMQSRKQPSKPNIQMEIDWSQIANQIPRLQQVDVNEFKQNIKNIIIKNRIYSDDDYAFLGCLVSYVNIGVEQSKILEIFGQALNELV